MKTFKEYLEKKENEKNLEDTLGKIPKSHSDLVDGFTFNFYGNNTLDNDDKHVGYVDRKKKEVAVAAPWNYGREFTILHEIGHRVWENLSKDKKKDWKNIYNKTDNKLSEEELFCMAYANYYVDNKISHYVNKIWDKFIKGL